MRGIIQSIKQMLVLGMGVFILQACGESSQSNEKNVPEVSNSADSNTGADGAAGPDKGTNTDLPGNQCQAGQVIKTSNCKLEISFSTEATKTETCSQDGHSTEISECQVNGCESGYLIQDNKCVASSCTPGSGPDAISCIDEMMFSAVATKERTCNNEGTGYSYGTCTVTGCTAGYYLESNTCKPQACTPGVVSSVSCVNSRPGSQVALQSRTCNEKGSDYILSDDCTVNSCATGYHQVANSCVANTCEPSAQLGMVSCTDEIVGSSDAKKSKACNETGSDYVFGSCTLNACSSGYHKVGNNCVVDICTPGATDDVSCSAEIPHSTAATKTRMCVGGASYSFGSCQASACQSGYTLKDNVCSLTFPQLNAATGASNQQVNLTLAAFPDGVNEVRLYRFTSEPPASYWQCLSTCKLIATFKSGSTDMTASFSWTDTTPSANVTYWYRYASVKSGVTHNDISTASANSSATAVTYNHKVFVTSQAWKAGALGGLAGADAKCAEAAVSGSISGSNFRAVLASTTQFAWERAAITGPLENLNGNLVAGTLLQFAHGVWSTDEMTSQTGTTVSTSTYFWMGDKTNNCSLWSAPESSNILLSEDASYAQLSWKGLTTNTASGTCNLTGFTTARRLLCIGDN